MSGTYIPMHYDLGTSLKQKGWNSRLWTCGRNDHTLVFQTLKLRGKDCDDLYETRWNARDARMGFSSEQQGVGGFTFERQRTRIVPVDMRGWPSMIWQFRR